MIGVGVDVEQLDALTESRREGVERRLLAPLGEVRHRFERQRHARTLGTVKAYYEARAREYDDWVYGTGLFDERDRPGWHEERERMQDAVAAMPPARTLDIACGTGWLTQHLHGEIVGLDASPSMLEVAAERIPDAEFVVGDALELPFEDGSFERLVDRALLRTPRGGRPRRGFSPRLGVSLASSSSSTRRCTTASSRTSGSSAC